MRKPLPQRRRAETIDLLFRNQAITVTARFYPGGELGEIFVDAAKSGADIQNIAHDAAVVVSLAPDISREG